MSSWRAISVFMFLVQTKEFASVNGQDRQRTPGILLL